MLKKALLRSRRYMLAGLLTSIIGSYFTNGVVPGAVTIGLVATIWIAIVASVETAEDLCSPLVARLFRGSDAAHLLVGAEAYSLGCTLLAIILVVFNPRYSIEILLGFILLASLGALVLDLAEEMFAGELAKRDLNSVLTYNIATYALIGAAGPLIGRPVAALVAHLGPLIVLIFIAIFYTTALGLRLASLVALRDVPELESSDSPGQSATGLSVTGSWADFRSSLRLLGPGSPALSGAMGLASGFVSVYLAIWSSGGGTVNSSKYVFIAFLAMGLGSTVGPLVAKRIKGSVSVAVLRLMLIGSLVTRIVVLCVVLIVVLLGLEQPARIAVSAPLLFLLSAASVYAILLQSTARQIQFRNDSLVQVVGWSHAFASSGALVGTWLGLRFGMTVDPTVGLICAAVVSAVAVLIASR